MIYPPDSRRNSIIVPFDPNLHSPQFQPPIHPIGLRDESWLRNGDSIPEVYFRNQPGFFLGSKCRQTVTKPIWYEGNIIGFGGSGLGKTTLLKPSMCTWNGGIIAVDLNSTLLETYKMLIAKGIPRRPFKEIRLMHGQDAVFRYDPFYMIRKEKEDEIPKLIRQLSLAIIPLPHDAHEPFWIQSAQNILTGALIYYFCIGVEFMDALVNIQSSSMSILIGKIRENSIAKLYVNQFTDIEKSSENKMLQGIQATLSTCLIPLITDPQIVELFTPNNNMLNWDDIETSNFFITIDEDDIALKSSAVRLLLTQLITHLKQRPDKHSFQGRLQVPQLLLIDEFPEFGKLETIESAFATLRKRNVTTAVFCQSLAQLDRHYGELGRRIILDNCNHQILLGSTDLESIKYFSEFIGDIIVARRSYTESYGTQLSYSMNINEVRERVSAPEELRDLGNEVLILTRNGTKNGFFKLDKFIIGGNLQ